MIKCLLSNLSWSLGLLSFVIYVKMKHKLLRGGTTGWTGVDMSTLLYFRIDFLIRLNSMTNDGGGVNFSFIKVATRSPRLQFNDQS